MILEEFVFDFQDQYITDFSCNDDKIYSYNKKNPRKKSIVVDLHNYTFQEAKSKLQEVIKNHPKKKGINLHIITGKGINSGKKGPVIKKFTYQYLNDNFIQWKFAKPKKGGHGAIVAFL